MYSSVLSVKERTSSICKSSILQGRNSLKRKPPPQISMRRRMASSQGDARPWTDFCLMENPCQKKESNEPRKQSTPPTQPLHPHLPCDGRHCSILRTSGATKTEREREREEREIYSCIAPLFLLENGRFQHALPTVPVSAMTSVSCRLCRPRNLRALLCNPHTSSNIIYTPINNSH